MAAAVGALVLVLFPAGVVLADPAGPTDYRSEISGIDPPTPAIAVDVLGGDSFLQLTVDRGSLVEVVGYRGEPYLRFLPDGTVLENQRSPTTYLNQDRYGTSVPEVADPDADPDWRQVGSSGRWSWHDHRAHLMSSSPPFGTVPGDRIVESVVPITVDGVDVDVSVVSVWLPEPSDVPLWIGTILGAGFGALAIALAWNGRPVGAAALLPVSVAVLIGGWQFASLPAETGPRIDWWMLPIVSAAAAGMSLIPFVRRDRLIGPAMLALSGLVLIAWAWMRRNGLTAAIVPSNAPNWSDRGTTAMALTAGAGLVLSSVVSIGRPKSLRSTGTERPAATT